MANKKFRGPNWSERAFSRRRRSRPKAPEPHRPILEAVAVVIGLMLSIGGALYFGAVLATRGLPFFIGYGGVLLLLGAASAVSARHTWSRVVTALGVLIALAAGIIPRLL